jgi:hypothetical protein
LIFFTNLQNQSLSQDSNVIGCSIKLLIHFEKVGNPNPSCFRCLRIHLRDLVGRQSLNPPGLDYRQYFYLGRPRNP